MLSKAQRGEFLILKRKLSGDNNDDPNKKLCGQRVVKRKCCGRGCQNNSLEYRMFTFPLPYKTLNGQKVQSPENLKR